MALYSGLKKRFLEKVRFGLENYNEVNLNGGEIHPSVKLKNVYLKGEISIAEGAKLLNGVHINAGCKVTVKRYASLNGPNLDIRSMLNPVTVGAFSSVARNVSIQEFNHAYDRLSSYHMHHNIFGEDRRKDLVSSGAIEIGNDVWIGTQCVILSGVKIGDGAVIAANSVVTQDIPPYAIAGGSPAKIIKYRFDPGLVDRVAKLKWWDWEITKIVRNKALFVDELTVEKLNKIL